ncbi:MAG: hypothetical protein CMI14_08845 [Oleispira sp.]|nr:hypothetical protein [Oleispira sp.]|tara:strand:- start:485 stop:991 length:507 start_codon:yes stop_codon:yes gene_type:complete
MKQFKKIDPTTVASDPRTVAKFAEADSDWIWYLLIDGSHLILAAARYHTNPKTQKQQWISGQIELPKQGLVWFCDTIKNKFFKTEAEGGLPKGTFGTTAEIEGENLKIYRCANADGQGGPGYSLTTLDRIEERGSFPEEEMFSDKMLFEDGLMGVFQRVANEIQAGKL